MFPCSLCDEEFSDISAFSSHLENHMDERPDTRLGSEGPKERNRRNINSIVFPDGRSVSHKAELYKCSVCNKLVPKADKFSHELEHINDDKAGQPNSDGPSCVVVDIDKNVPVLPLSYQDGEGKVLVLNQKEFENSLLEEEKVAAKSDQPVAPIIYATRTVVPEENQVSDNPDPAQPLVYAQHTYLQSAHDSAGEDLRSQTPPLIYATRTYISPENGVRAEASSIDHRPMVSQDGELKKPTYTYGALIKMAIEASPEKKATLEDIYAYIMREFCYKNDDVGWKNSIRHNLSLNQAFVREKPSEKSGRGGFWSLHPVLSKRISLTRKTYKFERKQQNRTHDNQISAANTVLENILSEQQQITDADTIALPTDAGKPQLTISKNPTVEITNSPPQTPTLSDTETPSSSQEKGNFMQEIKAEPNPEFMHLDLSLIENMPLDHITDILDSPPLSEASLKAASPEIQPNAELANREDSPQTQVEEEDGDDWTEWTPIRKKRKTPKKKSSPQSESKRVKPMTTPRESEDRDTKWYDLPDGWKKKVVESKRVKGKASDTYLHPPVGKFCRSNNDILKWVAANPSLPIDPLYVNMLPYSNGVTDAENKSVKELIEKIRIVKETGTIPEFRGFGKKPTKVSQE